MGTARDEDAYGVSAMRSTVAGFRGSDDAALMKQIESGDADAFGELYDRYGNRAYRIARSVCRDHGRAEDAVQEAFVSVWRSRSPYVPQRGTVATWLLTGVRYRAIDIIRRDANHARHRAGEDALALRQAPGESVVDGVVSRADDTDLHGLLQRLPDAQRKVILLAYYGELTHREIAAELGLPAGTVKGRMRLGLQKLRADLEPALV
jgi:RNA polymerase sigma-70 factor, ECF subfamily